MKKFAVRFALVAVLGVAVLVYSTRNTTAANLADPDIKEIMHKINDKGELKDALSNGLKAKSPKWDDLAIKAKELTPLAKALGTNKAPKGEVESWKKLTDEYSQAADDLEKAIADKNVKLANASMKTIASCATCHKTHKPAKK